MSTFELVFPVAAGGVFSLVCLGFSLRQRRRQRLLADLPTTKARGVFIGLVELQGSAEIETPLRARFAPVACVHHVWTVDEEWRRTTTENYTDSKGRRQTRTVTKTGWDTLARGGESPPFYLRDDSGVVLVRPEGATIEDTLVFSETVESGHPLYRTEVPDQTVAGSTGRRRFTEHAIPLHAPLYIIGTARERPDVVAPEIAAARGAEFIISTRGEAAVRRGMATWSWVSWALGLFCLLLGLYIGHAKHGRLDELPAKFAWLGGGYLALWTLGWVWMVHDGLMNLRERVRQAWSLIDVQLKRRHDLIPPLAAAVAGLAAHEREVQTALAALRAQTQATPPGAAGPDPDGLAPALRVVAERYPELGAQDGFARLHRELVETEQRIALARAYHNDIATHFATRLESIPDRFVARLRGLRPEPLLAAQGFERAPVAVKLADDAAPAGGVGA